MVCFFNWQPHRASSSLTSPFLARTYSYKCLTLIMLSLDHLLVPGLRSLPCQPGDKSVEEEALVSEDVQHRQLLRLLLPQGGLHGNQHGARRRGIRLLFVGLDLVLLDIVRRHLLRRVRDRYQLYTGELFSEMDMQIPHWTREPHKCSQQMLRVCGFVVLI